MKSIIVILLFSLNILQQSIAQKYTPSASNLQAREWFRNAHFGMFIHWGPFSLLGSGEWVLNNRNIPFDNYKQLEKSFNPVDFDADAWVQNAQKAGMKYITFVTRHHDGFSLWDTKYSDFNIMNTPYKKDIVKLIVDACHKKNMKIFLYYSLLDWGRTDYAYWSGKTGSGTGRKTHGSWDDYISFMKNQLTELLTNYGQIDGIWFDGYWDQITNNKHEGSKVDWHMSEIYTLIHSIQPQCLVGNNHHLAVLPGEDFQMFEQDIPGENTHGFNSASTTSSLPLESCITMNKSWGYNITDDTYKNFSTLIQVLAKSAGAGANLLLNVGPLPNGEIQPQFTSRLDSVGQWLKLNGESIYNTHAYKGNIYTWGTITRTDNRVYIHVFNNTNGNIVIDDAVSLGKIKNAYTLADKQKIKISIENGKITLPVIKPTQENPDIVVVLETQNK